MHCVIYVIEESLVKTTLQNVLGLTDHHLDDTEIMDHLSLCDDR